MKRLVLSLVFLLSLSFIQICMIQNSYSSSNSIYQLNDLPYGKSYQEWASRWWQWHIAIPSSEHPRENYTPEKCSISQEGPVWFLADGPNGRSEERECTMPQDKSIIVQVLGGECDYGEANLKNNKDVITCVDRGLVNSKVKAILDGNEITELQKNRIGHYWFNITVPQDNIYEEPAGTYRALTDGYFLFLKPLTIGKHELIFKGDQTSLGPDGLPTEEDHHVNVKYNLKIQ
jgi:hypothetical protein